MVNIVSELWDLAVRYPDFGWTLLGWRCEPGQRAGHLAAVVLPDASASASDDPDDATCCW